MKTDNICVFVFLSMTGATNKKRKKVPRQVVLFNDDSDSAANELRFDEKIDISNQQQQTLSESNFERLKAKLHSSQQQMMKGGGGGGGGGEGQLLQKGAVVSTAGDTGIDEEQLEEEGEDGTGSGNYTDDMISIGELSIDSPSIGKNAPYLMGRQREPVVLV